MISSCMRVESASPDRSAKAMTFADITEREMRLALYDLIDTGIVLLVALVKRMMRPSC